MIGELVARARSLWRGARAGDALQREMDEEFRLHQELRAADLVKAGHAPEEARRQARLEFGSAERWKHEGRRSRGLRAFDGLRISWLDVKLGLRMLARYPGITIVGGLAMAFAILVGAGTFELVRQVLHPSLPLPQGDRVVAIEVRNALTGATVTRVAHDFVDWRRELTTIRELGAYHLLERNLVAADRRSAPVEVAAISASAFPFTRVAPLLGRTLVAADERPDAPAVAVIGHRLWLQRFAGDSGVVGRAVHLGRTATTIVGVMPEGFGFPVAQGLWTPLRLNVLDHDRGGGPSLGVFGRLAPGASLSEARAELATTGRRAALDHPRTHQHLRPQVLPYARSVLGISTVESLFIGSTNLVLVLFLLLVGGNVALLMFARAATREPELVVRTALGAGRARIVGQLFAEALVLGGAAALVGLVAAGAAVRWGFRTFEELGGALPFWFQPGLAPMTIVYAALLTALGAAVAGILPALKVTRGLQDRLRAAGAGGGGLRFGGIWTTIIVAQIAVTVMLPVFAWTTQRHKAQLERMPVHIREAEFLSVRLEMDGEPPPTAPGDTTDAAFARHFEIASAELARRVAGEPGVAGVTFAERLPRMYHPGRLVELDSGGAAPRHPDWPAGHRVSSAAVATDYFPVIGAPILAGRGFHSGDLAADARTVVVNEHFVEHVLGGRNPIGRHLRYVHFDERDEPRPDGAPPEPWYQIVGVVPTMGMAELGEPKASGIYHPLVPGTVHRVQLAVHVRGGDPAALEPRLRELAAAVDPTLRLGYVLPMASISDGQVRLIQFWVRFALVLTGVASMLSLAGIYAVMSFTVARRTREIGIRVALGARASRVVLTILARPLTQVAGGVAIGAIILFILFGWATDRSISESSLTARQFAMLGVYAVAMLGVCLLACIVPTRRALRVQPTEALRVEG